ncbi:MAG: putative lipid II flippase FtsW [Actinomycetota bacterium]
MTVLELARAPGGWLSRSRKARAQTRAGTPRMTTSAALVIGSSGLLLGGGLIMILSSSWVSAYEAGASPFLFFTRQLTWALIGIGCMAVAAFVDYRKWRTLSWFLLLTSVGGLLLVLHPAFGSTVSGSSRWLVVGPLRFQPSELAKLALVLVGADICVRKGRRLWTVRDVVVPFGIIAGLLGLLVIAQPDLGTTLILAGIAFTVLFVAGARLSVMTGLGFAGVTATIMLSLSKAYRRARLFAFTNPFKDPLGAGYQAVQSQIALGSGGLFGVGLGASRQKWLYVPNAHTDFIFSIIGEEVGLIGTFAVIALFALLAYAGVRVARRAPDKFGRIAAGAITAWIIGQAVINMGAVTGLLPITGVPLPLVSFGGSSLVFTLTAIGILINIGRQEQWPPKKEPALVGPPARKKSVARKPVRRRPAPKARARTTTTRRRPR